MKTRIAVLLLITAMILTVCCSCGNTNENNDQSGAEKYRVGICQLTQHPALDAATQGFKDALTEKLGDKVKFDEQNASGESDKCATIVGGFVSNKYDLIMANATPALEAASAATQDIPILATSITDYATPLEIKDFNGVTGMNISGTTDLAPLDQQAEMIKELFPDAKKVGIIYCSAEANSKYQVDTIAPFITDNGYEVKTYTFADTNDVVSVANVACSECDVIYIPTDNTAASCAEAINGVASAAKKPIIAGEENICKACGVATLSINYYDLGYQTGLMAYEVLVNKADVSKMEIQASPKFTKEYNVDICNNLGIVIPDGYTAIKAD